MERLGAKRVPPFGRAQRQVMLDAITLESLGAAVVHVHRQGDGHGALRKHEPIAIVRIDLQVIGDDLELVAGHLEDFVVVDAHKEKPEGKCAGREIQVLFAPEKRRRQIELDCDAPLLAGRMEPGLTDFVGCVTASTTLRMT